MQPVDANQWRELFRLLDLALERDDAGRDAWIAADVPVELRPALRELLTRHAARSEDFLNRLPQYTQADAPRAMPGLAAGESVGPYRLVRELGMGGMGSVWLAERADGAYKRSVALKLPHAGWDRRLADRVARERDILASLEHPRIARFYDAGLDERGRPFMAMEHVEGRPIDVYCREQALDVPGIIALLLEVMAAVSHAHARLVVHRDLKPSNILVTSQGEVRLLDFGIARLLGDNEDASLTRVAGRAYTADYAAPEQIAGKSLSTSADVYSLGVVAYELLAGERPYRTQGLTSAELERTVLEVDPPLASARAKDPQRARMLRGDLDAVLARAMRKDAVHRYVSIDAFAQDLQRHRDGLPVQARPDSLAYRSGRFVRRNRAAVAASAAILVAIVGGAGAALWQAREASLQARLASEQAVRAEEVKRFVLSLFENADIDAGSTRATTAVDLLNRARERIDKELRDNPAVAVELLNSVGYSLVGLDEMESANEATLQSVRLATARLGENHALTRAARVVRGESLIAAGKLAEAEPVLEGALASGRAADDARALVSALRWLSDLRLKQGRYPEAATLADESVALAEKRLGPEDQRLLMDSYINQAGSWRAAGRIPFTGPARNAYQTSARVYRGEATMGVLVAHATYAMALGSAGELPAAIQELESVLPQMIALVGQGNRTVAVVLSELGNAQLASGQTDAARATFARMLESYLASGGKPDTREAGIIQLYTGGAQAAARRDREAAQTLEISARVLRQSVGPDNSTTRAAQSSRAAALVRAGDLVAADREIAAMVNVPPPTTAEGANLAARIALVRNAHERYAESLAMLEPAIATLQSGPPSTLSKLALARAWTASGEARLAIGDGVGARKDLEQARATLAALQPDGSADLRDIDDLLTRAREK